MFQDAFEKLNHAEMTRILDQVNPLLDGSPYDAEKSTILAQPLSFYPDYKFLEIADHTNAPPLVKYVIYKEGDIKILDWSNEPVYALNVSVPINLNSENVIAYALFFFTYIRGKHGRFIIIENVDDIDWKEQPPPAARRALGKMLTPITLTGTESDGTYNLTACMIFKDSLFKSDIHVKPNGLVSLSGEELLVEDMPVLDDTFGQ